MAKVGRKTKLTPEVQAEICKNIELGLKYEDSAILAGVARSTFYKWKARGEKAKSGLYKEFVDSLGEAEIIGKQKLVREIAANRSWHAKSWLLERRHPDEFNKVEKHQGDNKHEIIVRYEDENN